MTTRPLGSLTVADLNSKIVEPHRDGMPRGWTPVAGVLGSVRHFLRPPNADAKKAAHPMDAHTRWTSAMVKVPAEPKKPDHREILAPSDLEVEVAR